MPPTNPLRQITTNNACPLRITAAAGTKLARTFSLSKSSSSLIKEVYNQISCHPSRSIAGSSFRSLSKIPHCWLKKPGPCLSASVVDHSFKPTKDRRLGRLLIYQLPNLPQTYLLAILIFMYLVFYPKLKGNFLCITHPFAIPVGFNSHV